MADNSSFDFVKEMIELYWIHKKRCQKFMAAEAQSPLPLKEVSDDLALLSTMLSRIADEVKAPVKSVQQKQQDILGIQQQSDNA